jgi:PIN domain nuclease of toxin-antitoxin system
MTEVVLDASAILTLLRNEPGAEEVVDVIENSLVSPINEAEVIGKLIQRGQTPEEALSVVENLPYRLVDLDTELCRRAGSWWAVTRPQGLSLADRCCLALAERANLPALTADRSWIGVALDVEVRLIAGRGAGPHYS